MALFSNQAYFAWDFYSQRAFVLMYDVILFSLDVTKWKCAVCMYAVHTTSVMFILILLFFLFCSLSSVLLYFHQCDFCSRFYSVMDVDLRQYIKQYSRSTFVFSTTLTCSISWKYTFAFLIHAPHLALLICLLGNMIRVAREWKCCWHLFHHPSIAKMNQHNAKQNKNENCAWTKTRFTYSRARKHTHKCTWRKGVLLFTLYTVPSYIYSWYVQ